ncbi:YaaR family protein [Clostridium sp. 19966]|uniref:YaaR family protein n=1 Tax=Clostridium sp. 19966 TaxID=2768166 RepID=UPI0028DDAB2C|nr:YaaR family protein [Clostridium sp. 19966]MDT8716345.1 YaaR family protein [Clostridium sp. 19966]
MEIKGLRNSSTIKSDEKRNISSKKDFSQSFSFARERKSEEELKKMLKDIKKKGERLIISKTYIDVKNYKNLVKEYLNSVLNYMYDLKKDISFWQTQYFITVDTIDKKLEELTQMFLQDEKDTIKIASTVDEITGLVVDIYK